MRACQLHNQIRSSSIIITRSCKWHLANKHDKEKTQAKSITFGYQYNTVKSIKKANMHPGEQEYYRLLSGLSHMYAVQ
jgi:hypothetical protein